MSKLLPIDGLSESKFEFKYRLSQFGRLSISPSMNVENLTVRHMIDSHTTLHYLRTLNEKLDRLLLAHGKFDFRLTNMSRIIKMDNTLTNIWRQISFDTELPFNGNHFILVTIFPDENPEAKIQIVYKMDIYKTNRNYNREF